MFLPSQRTAGVFRPQMLAMAMMPLLSVHELTPLSVRYVL
jgi:hypothetical protein